MQITLPPRLEAIVKARMKTGQYSTPDAVVADALALLDQRPSDWTSADLKRGIDEGLSDLDEGRYLELDETGLRQFIDEVKARVVHRTTCAAEISIRRPATTCELRARSRTTARAASC